MGKLYHVENVISIRKNRLSASFQLIRSLMICCISNTNIHFINTIARKMLDEVLRQIGITKKQLIDKYNDLHPEDETSTKNLSNKLAKGTLRYHEMDGYTFEDGIRPTDKEMSDLYRILPNKKICYCGVVGHIRLQSDRENIEVIEY